MLSLKKIRWGVLSATFISMAMSMSASAEKHASTLRDAAWVRAFASSDRPDAFPASSVGRPNALLWDARLTALLKDSFPQRQSFWYDHSRLTSTTTLIKTFLGVPGSTLLDENRYVSTNGCVQHNCDSLLGMLWIDTTAAPTKMIFAGTMLVSGAGGNPLFHLWIFSSDELDWQHLPEPFLTSMQRWSSKFETNGCCGDPKTRFNFALATIVQPNGVTVDVDPAVLHLGAPVKEKGL